MRAKKIESGIAPFSQTFSIKISNQLLQLSVGLTFQTIFKSLLSRSHCKKSFLSKKKLVRLFVQPNQI